MAVVLVLPADPAVLVDGLVERHLVARPAVLRRAEDRLQHVPLVDVGLRPDEQVVDLRERARLRLREEVRLGPRVGDPVVAVAADAVDLVHRVAREAREPGLRLGDERLDVLRQPRVGFIVTNLNRPAERVVKFYNGRGTAEQWIKEGKNALRWTRLSCHAFRHNAVRLQLHALAYNLANFMRTLALPRGGRAVVAHDAAREAGEDRRPDRAPRPLRGVPAGRGGGAALAVRRASCGGSMTCGHGRRRSRHEDRER